MRQAGWVVDGRAGGPVLPRLLAVLPCGRAGQDEVEFLGRMGVRRIEGVGAEEEEAEAEPVARERAVGAKDSAQP
jgi:hypothetical protein